MTLDVARTSNKLTQAECKDVVCRRTLHQWRHHAQLLKVERQKVKMAEVHDSRTVARKVSRYCMPAHRLALGAAQLSLLS